MKERTFAKVEVVGVLSTCVIWCVWSRLEPQVDTQGCDVAVVL